MSLLPALAIPITLLLFEKNKQQFLIYILIGAVIGSADGILWACILWVLYILPNIGFEILGFPHILEITSLFYRKEEAKKKASKKGT